MLREYLVLNIADNTVFQRFVGSPSGVDLTRFKVVPYNGGDISTQGAVDALVSGYSDLPYQRLAKISQADQFRLEFLNRGVPYTFPDAETSTINCASDETIKDISIKSALAKQLLDEGSASTLSFRDSAGRYHFLSPGQYMDLSLLVIKKIEKLDAVLSAVQQELQALITVPAITAYDVRSRFLALVADGGTDGSIKNLALGKSVSKVDLSGNTTVVQATGFKTQSGTSSQFLKADGSLDSKAYLPLTTATASVPVGSPMATDSILGIDSAGNVVRSTVTGGGGGGGSVGWVLKAEHTVDLPAISQNSESTFDVTVTGASLKDTVVVTPPPTLPRYVLVVGTVTATNTVTVTLRNTGSYHDQASSVFTIAVIKDASFLPAASATVAGLIKVGSGLAIDGSGVLSYTGGGGGTTLDGTGFVSMSGATPSYITGTASQFLKANGSLDSSTYVPTTGDSTIDGNKSFTGSTNINRAATTGTPSFLTTTTSGTESLSWRYTEDAVGVIPANVWQLRSGGGSARALVVSGFDSTIWSTTSSTGIDTIGLTAASSSISGATSTGSLKIGSSSVAGQVWTATDAVGNGSWQAGGGYTLPTATAGTLGGIKIGSGLSIDGAGVVSAAGGGGSSGFTVLVTSSAVTSGSRLIVDTVAAAIVLTLPVAPASGDYIELVDAGLGGSFAINKCTVARNGKTIQGLAEDMDITDAGASVGLVYNGTEWRLF